MKEILRGDIWIADLDPVRGSEQGGRRPCIVIQNDIGNKRSSTVIVAAITSSKKKRLPTHVQINTGFLPYQSIVLLEQIRTLDKSRFLSLLGRVSAVQMHAVDNAVAVSVGMNFAESFSGNI